MLSELLTLGQRWTLVGGKGGVGKTTTAAALAVELARSGERVLVLSTDPAHSLGDALGVELGPEPAPVREVPGLEAQELSAERERERFLGSHRGALLRLIERGTYLDQADAEGLLGLTMPGMDELAALMRLLELTDDTARRVVVDTAPTGHTLRLLELPRLARGWLGALQAMEDKHRVVAEALVGAYAPDEVTDLLQRLDDELARLDALLTDPRATRFVLVTTTEPVTLAESRRLQEALTARGVAMGGVVVNRGRPETRDEATGQGMAFVPPLAGELRGPAGLLRFAAHARARPSPPDPAAGDGAGAELRVGEPWLPPADRTLYLVGGKGGVGKSTAAGALGALLGRRHDRRTLLLSTDPAGSLGEVLELEVGHEAVAVPGGGELRAQQVDAAAAWTRFRDRYREAAESLFAGLGSASADHRVVQRLIDLAPPGIDELVAVLEVVELLEARTYEAVVLDTAPTGHLIRLLETPGVALEWAHSLLRLLLKYRAVVGLGELAERLLRLSRELRSLQARLADPERTWALVVALPEALSVPETDRLLHRLRGLRVPVGAVLVNRLLTPEGAVLPERGGEASRLIALDPELPAVAAAEHARGPAGVRPLLEYLDSWRLLSPRQRIDAE